MIIFLLIIFLNFIIFAHSIECDSKYQVLCSKDSKCCSKTHCCGKSENFLERECCKAYQVCCGGRRCCDRQNCCGSQCCREDEECLMVDNGDSKKMVCCGAGKVCQNRNSKEMQCCKGHEYCCGGEKCCANCCNGKYCCKNEELCCGENHCCNENQKCCFNSICCDVGKDCCQKNCCEKSQLCGDYYEMKKTSKCVTPNEDGKVNYKEQVSDPIFEISFVPLGYGDSKIIKCLKGENKGNALLVDLGKFAGRNWKTEELRKFLQGHGKITQLIINNNEMDYYSYFPKIFDEGMQKDLERIIVKGSILDYKGKIKDWFLSENIMNKVEQMNNGKPCIKNECLLETNIFPCGEGGVRILSANIGEGGIVNPIVLKVETEKFSGVLFNDFDGEDELEQLIEELGEDMKNSNLFQLPGTKYQKKIYELFEIVNPEIVVSNNGFAGNYFTPKCEYIALLLVNKKNRIRSLVNWEKEKTENIIFQCSNFKNKTFVMKNWLYQILTTSPKSNERYVVKIIAGDVGYAFDYLKLDNDLLLPRKSQTRWSRRWMRMKRRMKRILNEETSEL